jgi:hypothetical protein
MIAHFEEVLRAGTWLGPSVLGSLCYRLLSNTVLAGDDFPGMVMLATAAVVWTVAGVRINTEQSTRIVPATFAAMFIATWFIAPS